MKDRIKKSSIVFLVIRFFLAFIILFLSFYIILLGIAEPSKLSYYPVFVSAYEKTPVLVLLTWLGIAILILIHILTQNKRLGDPLINIPWV